MILRYHQIQPRVVWKVHGAWIEGYDSQNKDKNITVKKNKSVIFSVHCIIAKKHVIPHPVIAAILNVILIFYNAEKQQYASQILQTQPKTNRNSY